MRVVGSQSKKIVLSVGIVLVKSGSWFILYVLEYERNIFCE